MTHKTTRTRNEVQTGLMADSKFKVNSTQIPNVLLDRFMPILSPGDWKIVCLVARKTYGWQKEFDAIGAWQFSEYTGLDAKWCSERCRVLSAAGLLKRGPMLRDKHNRDIGYSWSINTDCDPERALAVIGAKSRKAKKGYDSVTLPTQSTSPGDSVNPGGLFSQPTKETSIETSKEIPGGASLACDGASSSRADKADKWGYTVSQKIEKVKLVFDYYIAVCGRNPKTYDFTPKRQKAGMSRFNECLEKTAGDASKAITLMCICVDAIYSSDWHMNRDQGSAGKDYHRWSENVFPSLDKMNDWWNAAADRRHSVPRPVAGSTSGVGRPLEWRAVPLGHVRTLAQNTAELLGVSNG